MSFQNVEGNFYNKYDSKNPIERTLMSNFRKTASALLEHTDNPLRILEAGCGEGHFTAFIRSLYPDASIAAFDIGEQCIREALSLHKDLNVNFEVRSIYKTDYKNNSFDLVICSEVMEHLEYPTEALKELKRISTEYILITVPNEPLWRIMNMCRFKYLKNLGNTPGHVNHWNRRSFLKLIASEGGLIPVKSKGSLPWNLFLFKKGE